MATLIINDAVGQILAVLREAFEGVERWSYFLDHGPQFGLLGTLRGLDAAAASRLSGGKSNIYGATASGPVQASIASHAFHVAVGLEIAAAWVRKKEQNDQEWDKSWAVSAVDDAEWAALLKRLEQAYVDIKAAIEQHSADSIESFGGGLGAAVHAAYHLGRMQEKLDGMG
ncbi:hypothetical protein PCS_01765 [Desulfocurvibacter africanus PCS]|uniref:DinB superfamily n=1 Tax=Desulfocurvibacter africanus PCS TaxID=1262666 RepID=M5PTT2_DESAF|nr:hypothetical protein [Desulfocurvibacter africanus]EMG37474.1 hypothetical protein PCS_01765 [Desulfocurvibacter africanus PCS]